MIMPLPSNLESSKRCVLLLNDNGMAKMQFGGGEGNLGKAFGEREKFSYDL